MTMTDAITSIGDENEVLCWKAWLSSGNLRDRESLVKVYDNWLNAIVKDMFDVLNPSSLSYSDLLHSATLALLECIDRFDPYRGVSFKHFARLRVRGAISNEASRLDLAQKQKYSSSADPLSALVDLVNEMTTEELLSSAFEPQPEPLIVDAYASTEMQSINDQVQDSLKTLSTQESTVIRYHYYENLPLSEIATILSLSKGRVSQIHAAALVKIKNKVGLFISPMDLF